MKPLLTLIGTLFFYTISTGQTINCEWADFSTEGGSYCTSVAIDNNDNIFATGYFNYLSIGDYDLSDDGMPIRFDAFVIKYDTDGDIQWLNPISNAGSCQGQRLSCDPDGNVIVGGTFENTVNILGQTLISDGFNDIFITKMDNEGDLIWNKQIKSTGGLSIESLETDNSGNSYLYIKTSGEVTQFDDLSTDAYFIVAKYDAAGNAEWIKESFIGSGTIGSKPLAVSDAGDIYYTGGFTDTITFDDNTYISEGYWYHDIIIYPDSLYVSTNDYFLAKIDANGNEHQIEIIGSHGEEVGHAVATNETSVFVMGRFTDTLALDANLYLTGGGGFLLRYDTSGNLLNYKQLADNIDVREIKASADYLYVTGVRNSDIYLDKYDLEFNLVQSLRAGGTNSDYGSTVAVSPSDFVVSGGIFYREAQFGDFLLEAQTSSFKFYIAKLDTDLVPTASISETAEFAVYPNPVASTLYGNTDIVNSSVNLRVFNNLGQLVLAELVNTDDAGALAINLSSLHTGLYFVELEFEDKKVVEKIIKH